LIKIEFRYDSSVSRDDIAFIPKQPGLYSFFTEDGTLIYVGQTTDLNRRIKAHFKGFTNTNKFCDYFHTCSFFFEEDLTNRLIYEFYILQTNPQLLNHVNNVHSLSTFQKSSNVKVVEDYRCYYILRNNQQCSNAPTKNGYCFLHGGSGTSRKDLLDQALKQLNDI
jgi:hypothetical protein